MSAGLIAFFAILSVLLAFYAVVTPRNTKITSPTSEAVPLTGEPQGPFERVFRPLIRNFLPQTPMALTEHAQKSDSIHRLLAKTGNPWKLSPEEYVGMRVLSMIAGMVLLIAATVLGVFPIPILAGGALGGFLGFMAPQALISGYWGKRRRDIASTLPEALDLLRICMNAGNNFTNALKQTVDMLPPGATRLELQRVSAEIDAGRTLDDALEGLAYRCPTDQVEAFTRSISQANATGSDISSTLAHQAGEARADQERIVETKAQRTQTTLFLPIILFLLPALLVLIFAPSLSSVGGI